MGAGLALYRGLTWGLGVVLPPAFEAGPAGAGWRGALTGASGEGTASAGSVWVHAASMGEVGAAARWIDALIGSGVRPPVLLTTRTRAGLERARRELSGKAAARIAPLDLPRTVRALLDAACPARLDIVETEAWPNLILEARHAGIAVVFVSGTVSARSERRLRALGVAGATLFGDGVFALAQDAEAAARFRALGVPGERVRVAGDLKADQPVAASVPGEEERAAVVFGSFRPGEEEAALAVAAALEPLATPESSRRPLLIVAPRHADGAAGARRALGSAGVTVLERGETGAEPLGSWIERSAAHPGRRAAILGTRGELIRAYDQARFALVGGTFAPFGGHSPLEAAARGCPVIAGPHREGIAASFDAIARERGGVAVASGVEAASTAARWWADGGFGERSVAARRAAALLSGAARRGLEALESWSLLP